MSTATTAVIKPQIFAIMRNGHEVIRGNMVEVQRAIESQDLPSVVHHWNNLQRFTHIHQTMEEGCENNNKKKKNEGAPKGFFK